MILENIFQDRIEITYSNIVKLDYLERNFSACASQDREII